MSGFLLLLFLPLLVSACRSAPPPRPLDLLRAEGQPVEATVAGRNRAWVLNQAGKTMRIHDVVRRTLPATPPSALRYTVDVPRGAHLRFACGIPQRRQAKPGIEFTLKRARDGKQETLWSKLVDPKNDLTQREWLDVDVDLSSHAGYGVELLFETRGEAGDDPRAAFWANPAIILPQADAPLVVLYLVDTLRADHTSPYGYARDTTPNLSVFAKDSVLFEHSIASASWTKPATASVLTSLLPGRHRVFHLRDPLDERHVTIAEMLQAKGYATGAAVANGVIYLEGNNFEQGFDCFAGVHGRGDVPSKNVEAARVVDSALGFLDSRRGFPTFLYLHLMDPHVPYAPPAPFDTRFGHPPVPGHPAADPRSDFKEPEDVDRLIAQYDGDIAYGDQEFGRFVRELKARGLYDKAVILFTADHGEEFLDHGKWLHGRSLYDEVIRVPLIVKFPGQKAAARRVTQQVQQLDILPTLLRSQGLPVPQAPVIMGRPLQDVLDGGAPETAALSEISHRGLVAFGMRTEKDKYVRRFSPDDDALYFDLLRDPGETTNRTGASRERVRSMNAIAEAAMTRGHYLNHVRVAGNGEWLLSLRTPGWIEGLECTDFGSGERCAVDPGGRSVSLRVRPSPGKPRALSFAVRPVGAPVFLDGSHDALPLRASDVLIAQDALHPSRFPCRLPEIEPPDYEETAHERTAVVLAPPPADRQGVHLWLSLVAGQQVIDLDPETREKLKALGYLGN